MHCHDVEIFVCLFVFSLFFFFKLFYFSPDSYEGVHTEKVDENITDGMDSDNEVKSVSKRKRLDDAGGKPNDMESDDDEPDSDRMLGEDSKNIPQEAQNGDEEKRHSEEKKADESSEDSREQANREDRSDSEGNQETDNVGNSPPKSEEPHKEPSDPSIAGSPEISDDEPLVLVFCLAFEYINSLKLHQCPS